MFVRPDDRGKDLEHQSWSSRLKLFVQCGLPLPRFVAGSQLVSWMLEDVEGMDVKQKLRISMISYSSF